MFAIFLHFEHALLQVCLVPAQSHQSVSGSLDSVDQLHQPSYIVHFFSTVTSCFLFNIQSAACKSSTSPSTPLPQTPQKKKEAAAARHEEEKKKKRSLRHLLRSKFIFAVSVFKVKASHAFLFLNLPLNVSYLVQLQS